MRRDGSRISHARVALVIEELDSETRVNRGLIRIGERARDLVQAESCQQRCFIGKAMIDAARAPLRAAVVASEVLDLAERIAPIGNRRAVSDAGVAALLAAAGLRGAVLNVRINLPYLPPGDPLRDSAPRELDHLEALAEKGEQAASVAVDARLVST